MIMHFVVMEQNNILVLPMFVERVLVSTFKSTLGFEIAFDGSQIARGERPLRSLSPGVVQSRFGSRCDIQRIDVPQCEAA